MRMSENSKPMIMILCDYYLPGYKSGGGVRTIVNMVERLSEQFNFSIVTRDHDGRSDRTPYSTVGINKWNRIGSADVHYVSAKKVNPISIRRLIKQVRPDRIYLNSFFSTFTIFVAALRKLRLIEQIPITLGPGGEFSLGSLALKSLKKRAFILVTRSIRLYAGFTWRAASEIEKCEVERVQGKVNVVVAPDMPPRSLSCDKTSSFPRLKTSGCVRFAFISRLARVKNVTYFLTNLGKIRGNLVVDIFGPIEHPDHWRDAVQIIHSLPTNISVSYKGPLEHGRIISTLSKYHFFVLPTLGESFGHIIREALSAGCPVVISDRTPWRNLGPARAGWDIPLENPEEWQRILQYCVDISSSEYELLSQGAQSYAFLCLEDHRIVDANVLALSSGP